MNKLQELQAKTYTHPKATRYYRQGANSLWWVNPYNEPGYVREPQLALFDQNAGRKAPTWPGRKERLHDVEYREALEQEKWETEICTELD